MASPVFKTGVTRPGRAGWVRFPHSPARVFLLATVLATILSLPRTAAAQRTDSTRAGIAPASPAPARDTVAGLKVSPRRAFLTSFLIPGSMQVRLDRPKAATLFAVVEIGALGMSAKSWNDLSKAKEARRDTVGTPVLDAEGNPAIDPVTGEPKVTYAPRNPNLVGRIKARRTHLEDWLAAIFFNHLFAGADAYVAANLSDFDRNVRVTSTGRDTRVMARVAW